jgi:Na+-driven multidrug efflux pump
VTTVGILANLGLNYFFITLGWGIEGVALGTMGINMIMGLIYLFFALNHFFKGLLKKTSALFQLFSPFIIVGVFLLVMDYFWPVQGVLKKEFGFIILKGLLLCSIMSPFLWKLKNKIKTLGVLSE